MPRRPPAGGPPAAAPRRRWLATLRLLFAILVLAALGFALYRSWGEVSSRVSHAPPGELALALLFAVAALAFSGLGWFATLRGLGVEVSARRAAPVVFVGQLGKYVPGTVWAVLAQMELGRRAGLARAPVAAAYSVSLLINLVAGALVSLVCLPWLIGRGGEALWAIAVLPVGIVVLHPAVLNRLIGLALRITRRAPLPGELSGRAIAAITGWLVVNWLAYGAQAAVLTAALSDAKVSRLIPVAIGGYALASIAGLLFIIAPAGAGVREAVLFALLTLVTSAGAATAVVLVSRLVVTLADLVAAALAAGVARPRHRDRDPDPTPVDAR